MNRIDHLDCLFVHVKITDILAVNLYNDLHLTC